MRHSAIVYALLTQYPQAGISVLPISYRLKYSAQRQESCLHKWTVVEPKHITFNLLFYCPIVITALTRSLPDEGKSKSWISTQDTSNRLTSHQYELIRFLSGKSSPNEHQKGISAEWSTNWQKTEARHLFANTSQ